MSQTVYNSSTLPGGQVSPIYRGDATVRLADRMIRAGAIYSMASDRKVYRAIAIRDEWIVAVSEDPHGLDALVGGGTRVIDDADLTLVPAFYDTHQHLIIHAEDMLNVMVDHVTNLSQFLDLIAQRAAQTPAGQWIKTSIGWRESNLAEGRLPTAPELDTVSPNHPVLVKRGGHVAVANSLAMAMAGITVQHPLLYTPGSELVEKWGKQRTREVMLVRAWLDEGAQLAAGTDSPTSGINDLLWSIWGLVTRGTRDVGIQGPEYAIDQYTAFELYTAAGARLSGESQRRGTLLPNKLADLVAFAADPITCPVDELLSLKPSFTLVGGRVVYGPSGRLGQED